MKVPRSQNYTVKFALHCKVLQKVILYHKTLFFYRGKRISSYWIISLRGVYFILRVLQAWRIISLVQIRINAVAPGSSWSTDDHRICVLDLLLHLVLDQMNYGNVFSPPFFAVLRVT